MAKDASNLVAFLASHGWQFVRSEKYTFGTKETVRAWFEKDGEIRLLWDALQTIWAAHAATVTPVEEVLGEELGDELGDEQIEQFKIQGLI